MQANEKDDDDVLDEEDNDDEVVLMSEDIICDEPDVSSDCMALPIQSNAHAFHRQLPSHFLDQDDGVPLVTKFAHRKARQLMELVHSMHLHDGMFNESKQATVNVDGVDQKQQQQSSQSGVDDDEEEEEEEEEEVDEEDYNQESNGKDGENETLVRNKENVVVVVVVYESLFCNLLFLSFHSSLL